MRSTIASTALANSAPSPSRRSSYLRRVSRTSSSASGRKTTRRVTLLPTTSGELRTRGPLFRAQRQFPLALVVGQTLPQRHRQVGAIAGGSLNSCASTLDSIGVILSCSIHCGKRVRWCREDLHPGWIHRFQAVFAPLLPLPWERVSIWLCQWTGRIARMRLTI